MTFLSETEQVLFNMVKPVTPELTDPAAVVHQWVHAVVFGHNLFGEAQGIRKDAIIQSLRQAGVYTSPEEFKTRLLAEIHQPHKEPAEFKFIDLFAGIGGMRLGFQNNGGICVFSSEFEKHAQETYLDNYGELPFGDITRIDAADIPDHDVLLAGFPCQPFSHAGQKRGIEDTRGTLFHDIRRILETKQPRVALLENVRGLISHDKGRTLKTILQVLVKTGYRCIIDNDIIFGGDDKRLKAEAKKMVLRSRDFGIPQNRQRIYIVLWREDAGTGFTYPEPTGKPTRVSEILESSPDEKYTISDRLWEGHQRRKINNKKNGKGFGYGLVTPDSEYTNTISARYYKDGSEILIAQEGKNPRKLTPREAARLQGFPDDFKLHPSNVQAYKQFGNSVTVNVIEKLAETIRETFLS